MECALDTKAHIHGRREENIKKKFYIMKIMSA